MARRKRKSSSKSSKKKRTLSPEQLEKMRIGREKAAERRKKASVMARRTEELNEKGLPSEIPRGHYERMLDGVRNRKR
jgi:hypothetical protein